MERSVNSLSTANIATEKVLQKFWPGNDASAMSNSCALLHNEMHQALKPGDTKGHLIMGLTEDVKGAKLVVAIASWRWSHKKPAGPWEGEQSLQAAR